MIKVLDPLVVIILIVTGLFIVKYATVRERKVLLTIITIVYFAALAYFTLISRSDGYTGYTEVSLVPLRALRRSFTFDLGFIHVIQVLFTQGFQAALDCIHIQSVITIRGIVLNALLFVPFGYLMPVIFPKICKWWQVLLLGILLSLIIETIQLFTGLGQFDLDDLIINAIGTIIGWVLWRILLKPKSRAKSKA